NSYRLNKQAAKSINEYDEWRELAYYEYVREYIVKKSISPNFVFMYGYNISINCGIDFDKINRLSAYAPRQVNTITPILNNNNKQYHYPTIDKLVIQTANYGVKVIDINTGKALVVMTESPNYNLFGWASKKYLIDGNIRRQIDTGFHLDKVWKNII